MIHTAYAVRTLRTVAIVVGVALFLWSTGLPTFFRTAEAESITDASDTLSDSRPSQGSVHTIAFTTENGVLPNTGTIQFTFEAGFDLTTLSTVDTVSMTVGGEATSTSWTGNGVGTWGVATSGQAFTLTAPSDVGVASSSAISVTIGSSTGSMIVNPSATSSYYIDVGGTMQDTGQVRVAIIDEVTVSASVDTSLTFSVTGLAANAAVNGTTTTLSSTNVAIPFGTLAVDESEIIAQRLNVATNATNGYTVTVEQTGLLQSSTGATIDGFINGSNTTTPTAWQGPSAQINQLDTYGHWGLTSDDTAISARTEQFGSDEWVSGSTTPIAVMGHTGPADGQSDGIGSTTVGYQIEISALQEAGDDYSTELRYIATPTF